MGHGVQGLPGVYRQLHECTGMTTITDSCAPVSHNFGGVFCMQIANTEEYIDGQLAGNLGEVLIR